MASVTKIYILKMYDRDDVSHIHLPSEWAEWFLETKANPDCVPESLNEAHMKWCGIYFPYSESRDETLSNIAGACEEYHITGGIQGIINWYEEETRTMNEAPQLIEIEG